MRSASILVALSSLFSFDASADSSPTVPCTPDVAPTAAQSVAQQPAPSSAPGATQPATATPQGITGTAARTREASHLDIRVGVFQAIRGMGFDFDPEAAGSPPEYPGQGLGGVAVHVGAYAKDRQRGLGATIDAATSIAATFSGMDDTGYGDYSLKYNALEAALHYRQPVARATLDGSVSAGRASYTIIDLPESIQIPDTAYAYVGGGIAADVDVYRGVTVGAGARYQQLLSGGDVTDEDWYGAGSGHSIAFATDVTVPLPHQLYARAALDYRRITIDFEGSGLLAQEYGVWTMHDDAASATAQLGATF